MVYVFSIYEVYTKNHKDFKYYNNPSVQMSVY